MPLKSAVRNRNSSTVEKRKSYKPSNRYYDEKVFSMNNCLPKITGLTINKRTKCTFLKTSETFQSKIDIPINDEMDEINDKVLRLMGPSPRSLYVRKNVKILKTYQRSLKRECRNIDGFDQSDPIKVENKISFREIKKYKNNVKNVERVFDIITKDGKRFKLNPMRLEDSDWMLSCLENYVGINK